MQLVLAQKIKLLLLVVYNQKRRRRQHLSPLKIFLSIRASSLLRDRLEENRC
ncbi:unnamed protein product [Amoebophrya sp. A25]|nr:unnamed protein product [Amoebophrya sp. A25]|eukprot:GSA25T00024640001.1